MSAVIQDAVRVCRALSIRYLWIDALCIIQDPIDPSDWERESGMVGKVYQSAYFTICTLSAANCHQSFLDRSQHTFDFQFQSSLYPPARGTYTLHSAGLARVTIADIHDNLLSDYVNSSWHERGWVFQEEKFSERKILFGKLMVYFECSQHQLSENGEPIMTTGKAWSVTRFANLNPDHVYSTFGEELQIYSNRHLSCESDRLPALAGLAQFVSSTTGGQYLAGLWKEDLHRGLLWNTQQKQSLADLLGSLRSSRPPSWSWVSRVGYFEFGLPYANFWRIRYRPEYSDIDAWTILGGAQLSQFGEVESGTIRIRSKVRAMPGNLVLLPERTWVIRIRAVDCDGAVVAYCVLDWADTSPTLERGGLEMLLLSSSCRCEADRLAPQFTDGWEDDEEDDQEDEEDEQDEEDEEDEQGHQGETSLEVPSQAEMDNTDTRWEDTIMAQNSSSDTSNGCVFCDSPDHNRYAWVSSSIR
jgi:hypothetical protein